MGGSIVFVHGTWSAGSEWWHAGAPLPALFAEAGFTVLDPLTPFFWSGDVDGVDAANVDWQAAGASLRDYITARTPRGEHAVYALGHSHGGQVIAEAAMRGQPFKGVLTVATPVRVDLGAQYMMLRRASTSWVHIYSDERIGTGWQALGSLGLLTLFKPRAREMPRADRNVFEGGRSHSGLLDVDLWRTRGWVGLLNALREERGP